MILKQLETIKLQIQEPTHCKTKSSAKLKPYNCKCTQQMFKPYATDMLNALFMNLTTIEKVWDWSDMDS